MSVCGRECVWTSVQPNIAHMCTHTSPTDECVYECVDVDECVYECVWTSVCMDESVQPNIAHMHTETGVPTKFAYPLN